MPPPTWPRSRPRRRRRRPKPKPLLLLLLREHRRKSRLKLRLRRDGYNSSSNSSNQRGRGNLDSEGADRPHVVGAHLPAPVRLRSHPVPLPLRRIAGRCQRLERHHPQPRPWWAKKHPDQDLLPPPVGRGRVSHLRRLGPDQTFRLRRERHLPPHHRPATLVGQHRKGRRRHRPVERSQGRGQVLREVEESRIAVNANSWQL